MRILGLLVALLASAAASAEEGAEVAEALAAVPAHVRLAFEGETSPSREVQLYPLRALETLEPRGQPLAQATAPELSRPALLPRVTSLHEEPRALWFAAGASAVTSLGARLLLAVPAWVALSVAQAGAAALLGPVGSLVLVVGIVGAYTLADSAAAALVSSLVFDNGSQLYTSSFLASFSGHLAGNALAAGGLWLSVGFGGMLLYGLDALSAFGLVGGGAVGVLGGLSVLGVLPVLGVAFLASVALPAAFGTWAIASTAKPREGFVIDPTWRPGESDRRSSLERALPEDRSRPSVRTLVSVAIPGT